MSQTELPKGETEYLNYDPGEIEQVSDAVEVFEWLAKQNTNNTTAQSVYEDCAEFLEKNLVDQ